MIVLEKPICFLDIESTGVDREHDRIVELCIYKMLPQGGSEVKTKRFNPGIPIPESASKVHGIKDGHVKDCPTFKQCAHSLLSQLTDCDLAGYNSTAYDVPMLFFEFQRAGLYFPYEKARLIDIKNIFTIKEPRTLEAAYKFYTDKTLEMAHSAEADIRATAEIFLAQLERYKDLPKGVTELAKFSNFDREIVDISGKFTKNDKGEILFNFGKHKGEIAASQPAFLNWMLNKANFSEDVNKIVRKLLYGK